MLDHVGKSLHVGIAPNGITLVPGNWLRRRAGLPLQHAFTEDELQAPERLAVLLQRLLTEAKADGARTTIVLHDALVRMWLVTPPQNAMQLSDCEAAATLRFQALYGESPLQWELAADWHPRRPFVTCAVPRALLATLRQVALEHRLNVLQVVPQFIGAWNRWRRSLETGAWFGVVHDNVLTVGATSGHSLCALRAAALPADGHRHAWLAQHLGREALRLGLPAPAHIGLCGAAPIQWEQAGEAALHCRRLDVVAGNAGVAAVTAMPAPPGVALAQTGWRR